MGALGVALNCFIMNGISTWQKLLIAIFLNFHATYWDCLRKVECSLRFWAKSIFWSSTKTFFVMS